MLAQRGQIEPGKLGIGVLVALFATGALWSLANWLSPPWRNLLLFLVAVAWGCTVIGVVTWLKTGRALGTCISRAVIYVVLCSWFVLVVFPIVWVYSTSTKPSSEVFLDPFALPKLESEVNVPKEEAELTGQDTKVITLAESARINYDKALFKMNFARQFANSTIVVSISLVLIVAVGALAAYALARFRFRTSRFIFYFFLAGMMLPMQLALVPLFFEFRVLSDIGTAIIRPLSNLVGLDYRVSLFDNLLGLAVIYVGASLPFTIMVLVGFFRTLPEQLREAAFIDGAGEWQTFWRVMLPLARPGIVTVAIFNFLGLWNEYIYALTFLNSDGTKTIPLGLANIAIVAQYKTDYGMLFAGLVILITPTIVIYMLLQERLAKGITMGALKG